MREVAQAAGVSTMTVSNVLTGRRHVSPQTRQRVLDVVVRTGYQVNVAARSLRRGRTGIIGLGVPELDSHYFGMLGARLVARLAREGLRVVVEQTGADREGELEAIADSRVNAYDGLILSASGLGSADVAALAGDLPVVMLGERQDMHRFDHVEMSNTAGAEAAARLLLERGCEHLAVIGTPPLERSDDDGGHQDDAFRLRAAGVRRALAEFPGATALAVQERTNHLSTGAALAAEALRRQPRTDGLLCATDTLALGALRGLADLGVHVPDDVLVIGFDDVPAAAYSVPSLSSVSPGHDAMVEATVRLLLRRMRDPSATPEHFVGPWAVVERESTRRGSRPRARRSVGAPAPQRS
ncbi:LacI family DNA-binding transcriptional regulator [Kineococcus glutinatus]